jgi:hypothetical protein
VLADLDAAVPAIAGHGLLAKVAARSAWASEGDGEPADAQDGAEPPPAADIGSAVVLAADAARPGLLAGGREPDTEMLPLDLDRAQRAAVERALSGGHVAVEGPPGTGVTHTLVTAAAMLAALGRRVLVLCPRRASAEAFLTRLASAGLGELALDLSDGSAERARVIADLVDGLAAAGVSGGAGPAATPDDPADEGQESDRQIWSSPTSGTVVGRAGGPSDHAAAAPSGCWFGSPSLRGAGRTAPRRRCLRTVAAATGGLAAAARPGPAGGCDGGAARRSRPLGVSAYDAMVALADLMGRDHPPATRVRLPEPVLTRLDPADPRATPHPPSPGRLRRGVHHHLGRDAMVRRAADLGR